MSPCWNDRSQGRVSFELHHVRRALVSLKGLFVVGKIEKRDDRMDCLNVEVLLDILSYN